MRRSSVHDHAAFLLVLASLGSTARADELCYQTSVAVTATDFDVVASLPKFHPGNGTLVAVHMEFEFRAVASVFAENTGPNPVYGFSHHYGARAELLGPDLVEFGDPVESTADTDAYDLAAFDNVVDGAGASGFSVARSALILVKGSGSRTDSAALAAYHGTGGSGTRVRAIGLGISGGAGDLICSADVEAEFVTVRVCYEYVPRVTNVCAGDGTGTACPCSNDAPTATGCLNSYGVGSELTAVGTASVSDDGLVFTTTVPGTNAALYYQGTGLVNGGAGSVFGDGIRCVTGTMIRLPNGATVAGIATYPEVGDPTISVAGSVTTASTRYYQVWYRNPATFCTSSTYNLSNALEVQWAP